MSFPRYESYRDSGVEWLGAIPVEWQTRRLRVVVEIKKRIAGREGPDVLSITQSGIRVRDTESNDGQLAESYAHYQVVDPGDFAMNHMDLLTGWVDISDKHGVTSPDYRVFSLRKDADLAPRYLLRVLQNCYSRRILYAFGQGSSQLGRWRLPTDAFQDFNIPFPPLREQELIAAFLDSETAKIDALVEEQQRLIERLKEKRQAVIAHAVTKGLDPNAPMKDSGIEWLGEVPAHWVVSRLKFLARVQTGVAKGKDYGGQITASVPYLRVANVQDGRLDLDDVATIDLPTDEIARYLLKSGDVLMNEGGDFDKLGRGDIWRGEIVPCVHQNHVFAVRPIKVSSEWLNLFSGSAAAQFFFMSRSKQSTNLASISSTNLMELHILIPPAAEEDQIHSTLRSAVAGIDELADRAANAILLLQERRAALISAAVTGKIDVRENMDRAASEAEAA